MIQQSEWGRFIASVQPIFTSDEERLIYLMADQLDKEMLIRRAHSGFGVVSAVELSCALIGMFGERLIDVLPQPTQ